MSRCGVGNITINPSDSRVRDNNGSSPISPHRKIMQTRQRSAALVGNNCVHDSLKSRRIVDDGYRQGAALRASPYATNAQRNTVGKYVVGRTARCAVALRCAQRVLVADGTLRGRAAEAGQVERAHVGDDARGRRGPAEALQLCQGKYLSHHVERGDAVASRNLEAATGRFASVGKGGQAGFVNGAVGTLGTDGHTGTVVGAPNREAESGAGAISVTVGNGVAQVEGQQVARLQGLYLGQAVIQRKALATVSIEYQRAVLANVGQLGGADVPVDRSDTPSGAIGAEAVIAQDVAAEHVLG